MVWVLGVARRQPDIQIAYVSTWGMSTRHLALAGHLTNIWRSKGPRL